MGKYKKGTQAMLDAAKDDATLLPFYTVFVTKNKSNSFEDAGVKVVRSKNKDCDQDDDCSVRFAPVVPHDSGEFVGYIEAKDLLPSKKSRPKKWQNGTQAQLDAAKDDARLIPKKTYFKSCYGLTRGLIVHRIDAEQNTSINVLMFEYDGQFDFHNASDLEPIND